MRTRNSEEKGQPRSWEQVANWNRMLFDSFVRRAKAHGDGGRVEELLRWSWTAAWFASRQGWFGRLSSRELETELLRAAQSLPKPMAQGSRTSRPRWLHVLTEAYDTLGHTNLCRRWIKYDTDVSHDIILVNQRMKAPERLVQAARSTGGECVVLNAAKPLLERAAELRTYAWQNADVVVLHTHPEDVIATTAFGVPGGPPVVLVNHADHCFWVGCAVADLVLDIRRSGHLWTQQARGVERALILPLPLAEHNEAQKESAAASRQAARKELGIPEEALVFLTVGSAAKYVPIAGLNFLETAKRIFEPCPQARLIAVGPDDQGVWKAARKATGGRLCAWGGQPDVQRFCQAADVYLEGFPAGSLTALLEAGETGLVCVRAPSLCIPPFSSDSPALDDLPQPKSVDTYVQEAIALARDAGLRAELGERLQQSIRLHHCRIGWLDYLQRVKAKIPEGHAVYPEFIPTPVELHRRDWLLEYLHAKTPVINKSAIVTEALIEAWKQTSEEPQVDEALWTQLNACERNCKPFDRETAGMRAGETVILDREPHKLRPFLQFVESRRAKVSLWNVNRRIRSQGLRERLVANARWALATGNPSLARKWTYSCLWQRMSSVGDLAWLRMLVKTHLSPKWLGVLRRMCRGSA